MNYILKNWKTSLAGLVSIALAVTETWLPEYRGTLTSAIAVLTGMGLLAAKDGNQTGR
jgi:hypothetical protein